MANLLISKKANQERVNEKGLTPWQCLGMENYEDNNQAPKPISRYSKT